MNKLRVLFMGTPEFAVGILDHLVNSQVDIVGVVTAPDKPAGRGKRLQASAVKQYAEKQNIEVLQPTNLKSEEFQEDLKRLNPNLMVVVAFRMLPKKVWSFPEFGTFNLHASLLPQYRGAAPINWAIINGEKETGVTTFFIDEQIDTGKIIDFKTLPIKPEDDVESLHDKLVTLGAALVLETVKSIEKGKTEAKSQKHEMTLKSAPKLTRENTKINWNQSAQEIINFVRGLTPFPTAWTEVNMNGEVLRVKIYKVDASFENHDKTVGSSFYNKEEKNICVAVNDGLIQIKELQLPGKKRLTSQALVNGLGWDNDYRFI
ncbi:methionyl-tRNA formyltransferase [Psychroflexus sediminis]|uniref:Methionyl-tRNA formyltransferase n=1 Tax=Psychroflexus sediminis TaxID=470826 RepID=A0A1G7YM89_9FLAO|nr:methionyl-tRNA formyltransferase [Psychroflexus sediminis]SDG96940.1 methionyl-tRNA formyltransferase [Psychroflexus sediminis]